MYILAEIRYQFLIWLNLSFTNAGTVSKSCGDSLSRDSTPTKIIAGQDYNDVWIHGGEY